MTHYIFGARPQYVVTAPAVVAVLTTGKQVHVYRNAPLPTATRRGQVEHLLATGMIKEVLRDPRA